jgi:AcrR family transcriptional regulator
MVDKRGVCGISIASARYGVRGQNMPKLKPEEVEHRRQEIVDAARRCFLRSGFHQTTTDEICHEAAITPGGLYHYFGSKEEIISAVIEDAARSALSVLDDTTATAADARSAFQEAASWVLQSIRDPNVDSRTRFDIETWAETLHNEKLATITQKSWELRRQWLESLIVRAREEGMYRPEVDPRGLADLILAILAGLRVGKLLWRDDFDLEGALQSLLLMHAGRLSNGTAVGLRKEEARASKGHGSG